MPMRPDRPSVGGREVRLAGVLDDGEMVARGDALDRQHVRGLSIEVHGHDRARARSDRGGGRIGIEGEAVRIDVGKDRPGAGHHDRQRRVGRGERRRDHLVAGADVERSKRQRDRIGAGTDADGVSRAHRGGEFGLERRHFRTEHEPAARDHATDGVVHRLGIVARRQRVEADRHAPVAAGGSR